MGEVVDLRLGGTLLGQCPRLESDNVELASFRVII